MVNDEKLRMNMEAYNESYSDLHSDAEDAKVEEEKLDVVDVEEVSTEEVNEEVTKSNFVDYFNTFAQPVFSGIGIQQQQVSEEDVSEEDMSAEDVSEVSEIEDSKEESEVEDNSGNEDSEELDSNKEEDTMIVNNVSSANVDEEVKVSQVGYVEDVEEGDPQVPTKTEVQKPIIKASKKKIEDMLRNTLTLLKSYGITKEVAMQMLMDVINKGLPESAPSATAQSATPTAVPTAAPSATATAQSATAQPKVAKPHSNKKKEAVGDIDSFEEELIATWNSKTNEERYNGILTIMGISSAKVAAALDLKPANRITEAVRGNKPMKSDLIDKVYDWFIAQPSISNRKIAAYITKDLFSTPKVA